MPTQVPNARKVFNYEVEINGLNQFEVQKLTLPDINIEQVEHGDANHKIKTPGMVTVGNCTLEKIKRLPGADNWAWNWLRDAQNMNTGTGTLASGHKMTLIVRERTPTGLSANYWLLEGCWVCRISQSDFSRTDSENIIQTVEISVDRVSYF